MTYLVVHFTHNDNSYTIINDNSDKLKSVSEATFFIDDKWQTGSILFRAKTEQMCEKWCRNSKDLNESSYSPSDNQSCLIKVPTKSIESFYYYLYILLILKITLILSHYSFIYSNR